MTLNTHLSHHTHTTTMSPLSFKQQIAQLASELAKCSQLCQDIRLNRNIGSTHENLDCFQQALESAGCSLPNDYNTTRRAVGSAIDIGDERARYEMSQHILDVQMKIKPKLKDIAKPSRSRGKGEQVHPGFKELLRQWKSIYGDVQETILSLSRRIATSQSQTDDDHSTPAPTPQSKPRPASKKTDEATISMKEFDHLLEHLKNSWEEVVVTGRIMYVNVFDRNQRTWERPTGAFIKSFPRPAPKPVRRGSYDRTSEMFGRTASWEAKISR